MQRWKMGSSCPSCDSYNSSSSSLPNLLLGICSWSQVPQPFQSPRFMGQLWLALSLSLHCKSPSCNSIDLIMLVGYKQQSLHAATLLYDWNRNGGRGGGNDKSEGRHGRRKSCYHYLEERWSFILISSSCSSFFCWIKFDAIRSSYGKCRKDVMRLSSFWNSNIREPFFFILPRSYLSSCAPPLSCLQWVPHLYW